MSERRSPIGVLLPRHGRAFGMHNPAGKTIVVPQWIDYAPHWRDETPDEIIHDEIIHRCFNLCAAIEIHDHNGTARPLMVYQETIDTPDRFAGDHDALTCLHGWRRLEVSGDIECLYCTARISGKELAALAGTDNRWVMRERSRVADEAGRLHAENKDLALRLVRAEAELEQLRAKAKAR